MLSTYVRGGLVRGQEEGVVHIARARCDLEGLTVIAYWQSKPNGRYLLDGVVYRRYDGTVARVSHTQAKEIIRDGKAPPGL